MNLKMLRHLAAAAVALAMLGGPAPEIAAQDTPVHLTGTIPGGFSSVNPVAIYVPDNLYEYIDGQAVFYLSYRFARLEHGHYRNGDAEYYVDVYELGSPLSAFGAFRQQREMDADALGEGAEGAITDYLTVFYKGNFYVEIIPMSSGTDDVANMRQLATHVAGALPGGGVVPAEAGLFPQDGLEAGSERYVDEDLASYSFLGRGLSATYDLPDQDRQSRVFISIWDSADKAQTAFAEYRARIENAAAATISGADGIKGAEPYRGTTIVAHHGPYVWGIHNAENEAAAIALLEKLAARLPANR